MKEAPPSRGAPGHPGRPLAPQPRTTPVHLVQRLIEEDRVKRRIAVAAALAATLIGAAAGGSNGNKASNQPTSNPLDGHGKTLKVWLMVDAQSGWPQAVTDANAKFTQATGAQVDVEYQQWTNHLAQVDTTLAGNH